MKLATDFKQRYGPWALLTGGAEGMGLAFAEKIAEQGISLVLVDRQIEKLHNTSTMLQERYGIQVKTVEADLTEANCLNAISSATEGLEIGLLVSCAALGQVGPFAESDINMLLAGVDINIKVPMQLTHQYSQAMLKRKSGGIVLLASNAAYHGSPYVAHYAATKAYSLILGEGLWYEMAQQGVDVIGFAPGPTNTPGFRRGNPKLKEGQRAKGIMMPDETALAALAALGKKPSARPSFKAELETLLMTRILNRRKAITLLGDKLRQALTRTID